MEISDNTLALIVVIVLFTVTFISSALITYRIRRKKSGKSEAKTSDDYETKGLK